MQFFHTNRRLSWSSTALLSLLPSCCCVTGFAIVQQRPRLPSSSKSRYFGTALTVAATAPSLSTSSSSSSLTPLSMKVKVGICGLPNCGKSSLFNSLAGQSIAEAANYPFCTIDPHIAAVAIPESYLDRLGRFADSRRQVPATIEWVDIAGLVKGAHRGEGLGNRFLASICACDVICHMVRCFEDVDCGEQQQQQQVVHVAGRVDPVDDIDTINLELLMADLAHAERRLEKTTCAGIERATLEQICCVLYEGKPARSLDLSFEEIKSIKSMGLLTLKPVVFAFNVDEVDFTLDRAAATQRARQILESVEQRQHSNHETGRFALVSAKLEAELALQSPAERREYLSSLGMTDGSATDSTSATIMASSTLQNLVKEVLNLGICYTGPGVPPERSQTTKAHLFRQPGRGGGAGDGDADSSAPSSQMTAYDLAGRIHGELQKGFIRAEVIAAEKLLEYDSLVSAREAGVVSIEGRDYPVKPNDVVVIRWK